MVLEAVKIKVRPLEECKFPYAHMLTYKDPVFPDVDPGEGRVALEMRHLKHWAKAMRLEQLAIHFSYNQTYVGLEGLMCVIVAPPPRNRHDDISQYEFDYDRVSAYTVKAGQAVFVEKGAWHFFISLSPECNYLNVTRKDPGESVGTDTAGSVKRIHELRPYIEFVDLAARDGKVIELEYAA